MNEKTKLPECANAPGCGLTAEEITAALKTCARSDASACRSCPMGLKEVDGRCCFDALRLMTAELIKAQAKRIAELEEQLRWIPVTERMPELTEGEKRRIAYDDYAAPEYIVMILGAKKATALYFDGEYWYDLGGAVYPVTHWRPMPKATEEAGDS